MANLQSLCWAVTYILIFTLSTISHQHFAQAIVNAKIDRVIDLSSQLVKITERITIEDCDGQYVIQLPPNHRERLAYIDATLSGIPIDLVEKADGSFEADFAGKSPKQPLVVTSIYTKLLEPFPAEITQRERQLVRYVGLQSTMSPYATKVSSTRIKLPVSSRLESFTKASKMTTGSNKLTYGPFNNVQPGSTDPLSIHFENNNPFVAVTELERIVEVSPWSHQINVVNQVKVVHVGAKLKGPFSRFDYQHDTSNAISSVRSFAVELPKSAFGIYLRDGIGNISTSSLRSSSIKTTVTIKPRFPLLGGWTADFNLGYRLPINEFVNKPVSGNNFRLSIPFADVLYENMFIEDATVKVYLPAGATNVDVIYGSASFKRVADDVSYSYLDVIGRPVVIFKMSNVVGQHLDGKPLVIRYDYSKLYMAQEPLLLLAALFGLLVVSVIYSKMQSMGAVSSNSGNKISGDLAQQESTKKKND